VKIQTAEKNMTTSSVNQNKSFIIFSKFIGKDQVYITASITDKNADPISTFSEMYVNIIDFLTQEKMVIVTERIFGSLSYYSAISKMKNSILQNNGNNVEQPFTYIQGQPYWGNGIAGIQITAIANEGNNKVSMIYENGIPIGRKWLKHGTTFITLQGIYSNQIAEIRSVNRKQQACGMFERVQKLLNEHSAAYHNVVRTWIFLADILDWYSEFNEARNSKYNEFGFFSEQPVEGETEQIYLPASTGIFGLNPFNAASIMDVLAIVPRSNNCVKISQMSGTKQRSPFRYGSAFSRAMKINEPDNITIFLSGTASIDKDGKTLFEEEPKSQILKTLEIVSALVQEEGATLNDICSATVFLKRPEDFAIYQKTIAEKGLDYMPAVCVIADICRKDLLFELDATVTFELRKSAIEKTLEIKKSR